jgi:flagellar hook-length control protein FliK
VPAVPAEPVPVASVTTTFGQFAAHLDSSPESQVSAQSGFVASNSALTAALSKPVNEGSGVYSVTAMLNPPSLGRVQAVVRVDGGDVSVSIVAHSPEGHLAIAGHIDELRQALATSGGDVQLSLADGGGKGTQHQGAEGTSAGSGDDDEVTDTIVLTASPAPSPGRSLHIIL